MSPNTEPVGNLRAGLTLNQGNDKVSYAYERPGATAVDFGYQLVNDTIRSASVTTRRTSRTAPR